MDHESDSPPPIQWPFLIFVFHLGESTIGNTTKSAKEHEGTRRNTKEHEGEGATIKQVDGPSSGSLQSAPSPDSPPLARNLLPLTAEIPLLAAKLSAPASKLLMQMP